MSTISTAELDKIFRQVYADKIKEAGDKLWPEPDYDKYHKALKREEKRAKIREIMK